MGEIDKGKNNSKMPESNFVFEFNFSETTAIKTESHYNVFTYM